MNASRAGILARRAIYLRRIVKAGVAVTLDDLAYDELEALLILDAEIEALRLEMEEKAARDGGQK